MNDQTSGDSAHDALVELVRTNLTARKRMSVRVQTVAIVTFFVAFILVMLALMMYLSGGLHLHSPSRYMRMR